ncbi:MAG: DNA repair protein RecN [Proteobacteria bacterium]|nr:DNA repair protein RecN [Pseudomonadota bacterium]
MLTHLRIKNFTLIDECELDFNSGMTTITGETGAGKSILIDALELCLGNRADQKVIRSHQEKCELTASFSLKQIPKAKQWLIEHDLESDDECILRRVITKENSRSTINGQPMPLQLTRELAEIIINIHGQHEHQTLLKRETQREILDDTANHPQLLNQVKQLYGDWKKTDEELSQFIHQGNDPARQELLRYQVQELTELSLTEQEFQSLESEHKMLSQAESIITSCQQALAMIENDEEPTAVDNQLHQAIHRLQNFSNIHPKIATALELLQQAHIQIEEAANELTDYLESFDADPKRLQILESRLDTIYQTARKYRVKPEQLPELLQTLQNDLERSQNSEEKIIQLQKTLQDLKDQYTKAAQKLHDSRQKQAKKLEKEITASMQHLGMVGGKFQIQLTSESDSQPKLYGLDKVEFLVNANPGQSLQSMSKVASGGELSRISLAIQVITCQTDTKPTLVFDEVDVGIGGGTAEIIGKLLRQLGQSTQVLCITHLAQVAAQAHHHIQVSKFQENNNTHTEIRFLNTPDKIQEIARMMGGVKMTKQTLAHAEEMLNLQET